jgi:hypothetical protein
VALMGKELWERVRLDDAARRRLVRACEAGVTASALEERFGADASQLRRMARAAGWDGVARLDLRAHARRDRPHLLGRVGQPVTPGEWRAGAILVRREASRRGVEYEGW